MSGQIYALDIGNMASGKTTTFARDIADRMEFGKENILIIKPEVDKRSPKGFIEGRKGQRLAAKEISEKNPWGTLVILREEEIRLGKKLDAIAYSEMQFYEARFKSFYRLIKYLLEHNYNIIGEGLNLNFRGEPYISTAWMIALAAEKCRWHWSTCSVCHKEARYSQRLFHGQPDHHNSPVLLVDGAEGYTYEPRCFDHFSVPGRPWPPKSSA